MLVLVCSWLVTPDIYLVRSTTAQESTDGGKSRDVVSCPCPIVCGFTILRRDPYTLSIACTGVEHAQVSIANPESWEHCCSMPTTILEGDSDLEDRPVSATSQQKTKTNQLPLAHASAISIADFPPLFTQLLDSDKEQGLNVSPAVNGGESPSSWSQTSSKFHTSSPQHLALPWAFYTDGGENSPRQVWQGGRCEHESPWQ